MASDAGANFGERRPGGFDMTANYKIGWGDSADWYNYTRKIPAGIYSAMVALSNGDAGAPAGTPDRMGGKLSIVTSGVGTTTQTLKDVGTFNGPSSGAWSYNNLVPLYAPDGSQAAFKITSPTTTLRFSLREGDYDWFVLFPVTGIAPKVTAASPPDNPTSRRDPPYAVKRDAQLSFTIEDFNTAVVQSSVKLIFDGSDVTSTATINKNADITTVTFDPPGLMDIGSTHSYSLIFGDNGTPSRLQTNSATFLVHVYPTLGTFLIEAEDFDSGGGQHQAGADTMPYLGGAYATLAAVHDVDYHANDTGPFNADGTPSSWLYRTGIPAVAAGPSRYVPMDPQMDAGTLDVDRGTWTATNNFKIGWTATGEWYNYTRNIPANNYQVWAALSHGNTGPDLLAGGLDLVTSGVGSSNQTVQALGTFKAPGTGGWGNDGLVPLQDASGNTVVVTSAGGVQTLRFDTGGGDYDYFLLVPATTGPQIRINSIAITGGQVTIQWTGGGSLEWTTSLTPPATWTPTGNSSGSFSESVATAGNKFYRAKQ